MAADDVFLHKHLSKTGGEQTKHSLFNGRYLHIGIASGVRRVLPAAVEI